MFQVTRVSLLGQAVLQATRRIIPFPGLTQASNVAGVLAACRAIGTNTATAKTATHAKIFRRVNLIVIFVSFFLLRGWNQFGRAPAIYGVTRIVSRKSSIG